MSKRYYAVKTPDGKEFVFTSWSECKKETSGKSNYLFKGFDDPNEMKQWLKKQRIISDDLIPDGYVEVYTDGSYNINTGYSGWAFAVIKPNDSLNDVFHKDFGRVPSKAESRQIDGELYAAALAIDWGYKNNEKIVIVHDYAGVAHFALGNWQPKSNKALDYSCFISHFPIEEFVLFKKIHGHSGNKWNDYVDKLAKIGCGVSV